MKKKEIKQILILALIGILYLLFFTKYKIGIPCIFHEITGLYCPGCGGTRAMFSLIKLDFYQAMRYNALIILFPILIIILMVNKKIPKAVWYIILIIVILFGIIRNIPIFKFLIPTTII